MNRADSLSIVSFSAQLGDAGTPWHARYAAYRLAELTSDDELAKAVRTVAAGITRDLNRSGKYSWEPCTTNPRIQATALRILIAQKAVKAPKHVGAYLAA